jgi:hypothetical protein
MYTLCIRYTLDPNRLKHFRDYVEHELAAIRNAGGKIVGYWLPTDFAELWGKLGDGVRKAA